MKYQDMNKALISLEETRDRVKCFLDDINCVDTEVIERTCNDHTSLPDLLNNGPDRIHTYCKEINSDLGTLRELLCGNTLENLTGKG